MNLGNLVQTVDKSLVGALKCEQSVYLTEKGRIHEYNIRRKTKKVLEYLGKKYCLAKRVVRYIQAWA